jgi:hypothetical protein
MGCGASAPAAPPTLGSSSGSSLECRGAATDQLPLLQGVLVISPGHRISAARNTATSSAQPQQRRPDRPAEAALSA